MEGDHTETVMVERFGELLGVRWEISRAVALELERRGWATCETVDVNGGDYLRLKLTIRGKVELAKFGHSRCYWWADRRPLLLAALAAFLITCTLQAISLLW